MAHSLRHDSLARYCQAHGQTLDLLESKLVERHLDLPFRPIHHQS
jgi:hypothetical protein